MSFCLIEGDMDINSEWSKKDKPIVHNVPDLKKNSRNSELGVLYRERMSGGENTTYRTDATDLYIY